MGWTSMGKCSTRFSLTIPSHAAKNADVRGFIVFAIAELIGSVGYTLDRSISSVVQTDVSTLLYVWSSTKLKSEGRKYATYFVILDREQKELTVRPIQKRFFALIRLGWVNFQDSETVQWQINQKSDSLADLEFIDAVISMPPSMDDSVLRYWGGCANDQTLTFCIATLTGTPAWTLHQLDLW